MDNFFDDFDETAALAELLKEDILFASSRHYVDINSDKILPETIVLFINTNDLFLPAADAETLTLSELPNFYQAFKSKGRDGVIEYLAIHKYKGQPRKRVKLKMITDGNWTQELENLPENRF